MKPRYFFPDGSGGAAAEYALILAIVGLGIAAALAGLKTSPPATDVSPPAAGAPAR